jgi:hypothetical protein
MHYYLIINEGLSNGLTHSQVLKPIQFNGLEGQVGVISIEKPGSKVQKLSGIRYKIIPFGIPYRLFLFNNLAFLLVPFLAFVYALILSLLVKKGDVLIARSYFPGIVLYYLKKIKGNQYKFDSRSLFVHESVTKKLFKEGSPLYKKWLAWEKSILEHAEMVIVVAQKQEEYYVASSRKALKIRHIPCYASGSPNFSGNRQELLPFTQNDVVIAYYGSLDHGWNNIDTYYKIFNNAIKEGYKICVISQNFKELMQDPRFNNQGIFIVDTNKNKNYAGYLQVCDYGVVIMPRVSDWETRLSVKFAEYTSNGLGVLVGEYVGEAVRLSNQYFRNSNIVLREPVGVLNLRKFSDAEKSEIKGKAEELFSLRNFKKMLD